MKKASFLLFLAIAVALTGFSQPKGSTDLLPGNISRVNNETASGTIKTLFKARGVILFTPAAGKKEQLSPNDLSGFRVNNEDYISYASDFYQVLVKGERASLLQRATANNGKVFYNGSQAVSSTSLPGGIGDFYIQLANGEQFKLVSADNFEQVASELFAGCATVVAEIKARQLDFSKLADAVTRYNGCK
ncbi:MAG TPA: hypothetical protein VJ552_07125 [Sediminibacterium sp.]|nr:hypothetical protein [Sediminibacterium sp.]